MLCTICIHIYIFCNRCRYPCSAVPPCTLSLAYTDTVREALRITYISSFAYTILGVIMSGAGGASKFRLRFGKEHKMQKALGYLVMRVDLGKEVVEEDRDVLRFYYDMVTQQRVRYRVIGTELDRAIKAPKVSIEFGDFDRPVPSRNRLLGLLHGLFELLEEGLR